MMSRTHIHMALAAGMGSLAVLGVVGATTVGLVTIADVALWCAVAGGSGPVDDLDHRSSRATRSLGPVTWVLHHLVVWMDRVVYGVTRGPLDPPTYRWGRVRFLGAPFPIWSSSHRRSTHTYPGAFMIGLIFAAASLTHPLVAVVLIIWFVAILGGDYIFGPAVLAVYFLAAVAGGLTIVEMGEKVQFLGPAWGAAVAVGCVSHCWGDSCTKGGAPLRFPLVREGMRWEKVGPPLRIGTDKFIENHVLRWLLLVLIVYLGWIILEQWVF